METMLILLTPLVVMPFHNICVDHAHERPRPSPALSRSCYGLLPMAESLWTRLKAGELGAGAPRPCLGGGMARGRHTQVDICDSSNGE